MSVSNLLTGHSDLDLGTLKVKTAAATVAFATGVYDAGDATCVSLKLTGVPTIAAANKATYNIRWLSLATVVDRAIVVTSSDTAAGESFLYTKIVSIVGNIAVIDIFNNSAVAYTAGTAGFNLIML